MDKQYQQTIDFLFNQTPQFQKIGAAAYKPGLDTIRTLASKFGDPQRCYPIIHVGGTNGKGSTSHTLASVLQAAGYKVGLYTSPHLIDFRERIRVNGEMISKEGVCDFVRRYEKMDLAGMRPSFFELTTIMAFEWFAREDVDVAVVEVGLGGRLDSTNIITPVVSVITNVSFDHMAQLGNTLREIAFEKSGIMKSGVTAICGEQNPTVAEYFAEEAESHNSPIVFAGRRKDVTIDLTDNDLRIKDAIWGDLNFELTGECQRENALTILATLDRLRSQGWEITREAVAKGFAKVASSTGLMGRWMKISDSPLAICDTGHNIGGWRHLIPQINQMPHPLHIVLGFVSDKDLAPIFSLLPRDAQYYFTNASIPRALAADALVAKAAKAGVLGMAIPGVAQAYKVACEAAKLDGGSVFVGGSTFVVADLLKWMEDSVSNDSN